MEKRAALRRSDKRQSQSDGNLDYYVSKTRREAFRRSQKDKLYSRNAMSGGTSGAASPGANGRVSMTSSGGGGGGLGAVLFALFVLYVVAKLIF